VLRAIDMAVPMHYDAGLLIYSALAGIIITLIATIGPALKSSKLDIIESIKYE
jgi:putative ABC transport system permease protein